MSGVVVLAHDGMRVGRMFGATGTPMGVLVDAEGSGLGKGIRSLRNSVSDLKEVTGIDEVRQDVKKSIAELKEEAGIDEMRRDLRKGLADLRDKSGIDEVRRELSSLDKTPR